MMSRHPAISLSARGRLETGGRFILEWHYHASAGENEVVIDLEVDHTPPPPGPPVFLRCLMFPHLPHCD